MKDILVISLSLSFGKHGFSLWSKIEKKHRQNSHPIIHCPMSEGISEVSERANERTDERVTQYFSLYSWLFSTKVGSWKENSLETSCLIKTNENKGGRSR